jgi:hypothetical protein
MTKDVKLGILATLKAKPGKEDDVATLLAEHHRISRDLASLQIVVRSRFPLGALSALCRSHGPKR